MIERGIDEVEIIVGGVHFEDLGFVEPTVFLNSKQGAQIYSEKIYVPVAVVKTFDTEGIIIWFW